MKTTHCSVIEINGCGILIEGPSGSGKTSLALGLVERSDAMGIPSGFVCDDQAVLETANGELSAKPPAILAGRVEVRGFGIVEIANLPKTNVKLLISLVPDETVERMPEPMVKELAGVSLDCLEVPQRHETGALRIVMAWLKSNGYVSTE